MSRPYSRSEINKSFIRTKAILHEEALVRGNGRALYMDSYTGKTLLGGDPYDYDHIFSSESLHTRFKNEFTDEQIAELVNLRENIAVTLRGINQSKGKKDPETWIADIRTILSHGIDLNLAKSTILQAKTGIDQAAAGLKK